jgi:uncharacterized protein YcnI
MSHARFFVALVIAAALLSSTALAHVSMSGRTTVGTNQLMTFGVGHGCEGPSDTVSIEVHIPVEDVTAVRAMPGNGGFGDAIITRNDDDFITSVKWEKAEAAEGDDRYYQFALRIGIPEVPFQTLYFPTTQVCRDAAGEEITVEWAAEVTGHGDEGDDPPAPSITTLPARTPGWNKYEVEDEIHDLSIFDDALIVWSGEAAYSSNPETTKQIEAEEGVETLAEIEAGATIWVKY